MTQSYGAPPRTPGESRPRTPARRDLGRLPRERTAARVRPRTPFVARDRLPNYEHAADGGDGSTRRWASQAELRHRSHGRSRGPREEALGAAVRRDPAGQLRRCRACRRHASRRCRRVGRLPQQRDLHLRRTGSGARPRLHALLQRLGAGRVPGCRTGTHRRAPDAAGRRRDRRVHRRARSLSRKGCTGHVHPGLPGPAVPRPVVPTRCTRTPPARACRSPSTERSAAGPPRPTTTSWWSRRSPPPEPSIGSWPRSARSRTWRWAASSIVIRACASSEPR